MLTESEEHFDNNPKNYEASLDQTVCNRTECRQEWESVLSERGKKINEQLKYNFVADGIEKANLIINSLDISENAKDYLKSSAEKEFNAGILTINYLFSGETDEVPPKYLENGNYYYYTEFSDCFIGVYEHRVAYTDHKTQKDVEGYEIWASIFLKK